MKIKLLVDLSILTLCAMVLGTALFLMLARVMLPRSSLELAQDQLRSIHQELTSELPREFTREDLDRRLISLTESKAESYHFEILYTHLSEGIFHGYRHHTLGIIPRSTVYTYTAPVNSSTAVRYEWSSTRLDAELDQLKWLLFFGAVLVSFCLVLLSYHLLFRRNIFSPIQNLWLTASAFIAENWSARCTVERQDELGQIAETLNEMARKIQEKEKKLVLTIQSLQQANEEIEASKNEQLQVEKLASVGRLAAGVAHEVGNPLGAIAGYVDILRRALVSLPDASKEDIELCDRIEAETTRISRIIRALLQQARPPQDRIRPTALLSVVKRSIELAQLPESIKVEIDFEEESAEVLCEKDQLIQVLLNLLINSKHAVEEKHGIASTGKIEIRCRLRRLSESPRLSSTPGPEDFNTSVIRVLKPQRYWVLSIIDNGVGISSDDRKKLFEPFFSTKQTGKGTGLGLYVAKSIIESFRGTISIQSAEGSGAAFSIFLPKGL